jgi:hypothetical protein
MLDSCVTNILETYSFGIQRKRIRVNVQGSKLNNIQGTNNISGNIVFIIVHHPNCCWKVFNKKRINGTSHKVYSIVNISKVNPFLISQQPSNSNLVEHIGTDLKAADF